MTDDLASGDPRERHVRQAGLEINIYGSLNPAIFKPVWFGREGLLRADEARTAEVLHFDEESAVFQTVDLLVDVDADRFRLLSTNEGNQPAHRDLALAVFALLRHTPLDGLSVTRFAHLSADDAALSTSVGVLDWHQYVTATSFDDLLGKVAPRALVVAGTALDAVHSEISVEPSERPDAELHVAVSYYFPFSEDAEPLDELGSALKDRWDQMVRHSETVFAKLRSSMLHLGGGPVPTASAE